MQLTLTDEQAGELEVVARAAVQDMSYEIAATDNAHYRAQLIARRSVLEEALGALQSSAGEEPAADSAGGNSG